jgi:hypothetical protein
MLCDDVDCFRRQVVQCGTFVTVLFMDDVWHDVYPLPLFPERLEMVRTALPSRRQDLKNASREELHTDD